MATKHLDACLADAKDRLRNFSDQSRVEVGLGLVPEQAVLVQQRAGGDQPRQHGDLAPTFGDQGHFHSTAAGRSQVETAIAFEDHASADLLFQRLQHGRHIFPPWSPQRRHTDPRGRPQRRRTEQQTGVSPGFFEFHIVGLVQRYEARIDRQQLAGRQVDGCTAAPSRRVGIDSDFRSAGSCEAEREGGFGFAELDLHFAPTTALPTVYEATETLRAEHVDELLGEPCLQHGLGGPPVALPAFLGAHRHCSVGQLEQVRLAHPVFADNDVELLGELESNFRKTVKFSSLSRSSTATASSNLV